MSTLEDQQLEEKDEPIPSVPHFPALVLPNGFPFFLQRYFTQYRLPDIKGIVGNNIRLQLHSNGLCILCIDPTHRIIADGLRVSAISFLVHRGGHVRDREESSKRVVGKHKKHALICQANMNVCAIDVMDDTCSFKILACVPGTILEVNPHLSRDPGLLSRAPLTEGYIAVINPRKPSACFSSWQPLSTAIETTDSS